MGCNCSKGKTSGKKSYVVTDAAGKKTTYSSEVEASAAARRSGGSYRAA